MGWRPLQMPKKLFRSDLDVLDDLSEQIRRDVAAAVYRHGGNPSIGVLELLMRSALTHLAEVQLMKNGDDVTRSENRQLRHATLRPVAFPRTPPPRLARRLPEAWR